MDPVQKRTFDKRGRNALKKVAVLQHVRNRMLRVADKSHGGTGLVGSFSTIERFVGQIVLHGVDQHGIHIAAFLLLELVPRHNIPVTDQPQLFLLAGHPDEQPG